MTHHTHHPHHPHHHSPDYSPRVTNRRRFCDAARIVAWMVCMVFLGMVAGALMLLVEESR